MTGNLARKLSAPVRSAPNRQSSHQIRHNLRNRSHAVVSLPSLQAKIASNVAGLSQVNFGKALPSPAAQRDEHRARIADALRLAVKSGQFTKRAIWEAAQIDRKTLDNWLNGNCDPTSWRIAAVSQLLGPWFFMHIFGGEIGRAMFERMRARVAEAASHQHMEADLHEIANLIKD